MLRHFALVWHGPETLSTVAFVELYDLTLFPVDWIGLDLLSGTGVATALRIVQWPTLSLTRPSASR